MHRRRQIAPPELNQHNLPGDVWVAVDGKVYDLSNFAARHPGGEPILLAAAGRDVTAVFTNTHGTKQSRILRQVLNPCGVPFQVWCRALTDNICRKFLIGDFVDNDWPTFPHPSSFAISLRERVSQYFADTKFDRKAGTWIYARYAWIFIGIVSTYTFLYYNQMVAESWPLFLLLSTLSGLMHGGYGLYQLHDGSHACQSHSPRLWSLMVYGHDFLNGLSHTAWYYQHGKA